MKYTAFLSYSHRDKSTARWFHRRLENWRVARDLVGRETACGLIPRSLSPVFMDREDFPSGPSLKEATRDALEASQHLVLLCSPHSAQSVYVNEEVRQFKEMGKAHRIIPIIIDGEPGDPARECFPISLRDDGTAWEPVAADARPQGDGPQRALEKAVAGLLGLPFDEIARRAERRRKNRRALLMGGMTGAFVFATGFSSFALYRSYQAGLSMEKSVFTIGGLVQQADGLRQGDARSSMLRALCDLMDELSSGTIDPGPFESTICLCERAWAERETETASRARDLLALNEQTLQRTVLADPKPSFDKVSALVKATTELGRMQLADAADTDAEIAIHQAVEETCRAAGDQRPDIGYLRRKHDEWAWALCDLLEGADRFKESIAVIDAAAALRARQSAESSAAIIDRALYLRRKAWLCAERLEDHPQALQVAQQSLAVLESVPVIDRDTDFEHEWLLGLDLVGNEYWNTEAFPEARENFAQALRELQVLQDRLDPAAPLRLELEQLADELSGKLEALSP